jgi:hypothetical protein
MFKNSEDAIHIFPVLQSLRERERERETERKSLKRAVVCGAFRWSGRAFHCLGAAAEKA